MEKNDLNPDEYITPNCMGTTMKALYDELVDTLFNGARIVRNSVGDGSDFIFHMVDDEVLIEKFKRGSRKVFAVEIPSPTEA